MDADERERYAPHIFLKEIGGAGQRRIRAATCALVGVGALGAPAALYLAAAGIGRLRLIDHDAVSLSNLQRQIIYREADIGAAKVERAATALAALNSGVALEPCAERLTAENAADCLRGAEVVLDGTDDFATRFAVNAACRELGLTLVSGAVGRWDGQVATFTRDGPCYRCLVPESPENAPPCERNGIIGALPGVIGAMMALEAIKEVAQAGSGLGGRLLIYDALNAEVRTVALRRDPACPVCGDA